MKTRYQIIRNFILRIIALPFLAGIVFIRYNWVAIEHVISFLLHGGEWINYMPNESETIREVFNELKKVNSNSNNSNSMRGKDEKGVIKNW